MTIDTYYGTDVIEHDTTLQTAFIEAWDIVIQRNKLIFPQEDFDTIAYIPNRIVRSAEARIKKAFAEKNFTKCYQIFEDAYVFTPITGTEWQVLKANNEQ